MLQVLSMDICLPAKQRHLDQSLRSGVFQKHLRASKSGSYSIFYFLQTA